MTNLAATERSEIALAFRSRLLEIQARRIDAAARLRLLTGVEAEPKLVLDLSQPVAPMVTRENATDDSVQAATVALEASRARLREVTMFSGFRATLSGFGGFGGASSRFRDISSRGSFGVYGLRLNLSYPLFRGGGGVAVVEARADVAQSEAIRAAAVEAARLRAAEYQLREETSRRRIALLQQSIEVAKQREESLQRLVSAGIRSDSDLAQARGERVRREADLLAAQVERWKAARLLARMTTAESQSRP
jgi:outer membrane protein TolC